MTLAAVSTELARHGIAARLVKADNYFYFTGPAVTGWLGAERKSARRERARGAARTRRA